MLWVHKRSLPIPALSIADPALVVAYRHWSDSKEDMPLPARCRVDTPVFRLVVPDVAWLDAGHGYTGRLVPFASAGQVHTASIVLGEVLQDDLATICATGVPQLQLIELRVGDKSLVYQQLLLPTADDGRNPTEVLEVARLGPLTLVRPGGNPA